MTTLLAIIIGLILLSILGLEFSEPGTALNSAFCFVIIIGCGLMLFIVICKVSPVINKCFIEMLERL